MDQTKKDTRQTKNLPVAKNAKAPSKHRNIMKPSKSSQNPKLFKISSATKLDKKSQRNKHNPSQLEEMEVERAFRVHGSSQINQGQSALSLKLLGCNIGEKKQSLQFGIFWKRLNKGELDLSQFFDLYYQMGQSQSLQRNYDVFGLIAKGDNMINGDRLQTIADTVNWTGDIKQIIQFCGSNGNITFQQFNRAIKISSALF